MFDVEIKLDPNWVGNLGVNLQELELIGNYDDSYARMDRFFYERRPTVLDEAEIEFDCGN